MGIKVLLFIIVFVGVMVILAKLFTKRKNDPKGGSGGVEEEEWQDPTKPIYKK